MGQFVNPDNELFKDSLNSEIYVDKSLIIEKLNDILDTQNDFICVSRPRRFGKTMATSLITALYSKGCDSRDLLSNLKIADTPDWDKNLNKFNVIKLDVQGFIYSVKSMEDLPDLITKKIKKELIKEFNLDDIEPEDTLADSIYKAYAATGEKFVFIMDEYDVLIRKEAEKPAFDNYLNFLNSLFKNSNIRPAFHLVYLTGILPIVRDKIQSKLNEFTEYSMTDAGELSGFLGFTEDEVKSLCNKYNMNFEECKAWYNGYKISNTTSIYNPLSVVKAMTRHKFGDYWTTTGSYEALKNYILMDYEGIRKDIVSMLSGNSVEVNIYKYLNTMTSFHSKDDIFTYLIHLGYLAYDEDKKVCWIPNKEIASEWVNSIENEKDYSEVVALIKNSKALLEHTLNCNEEAVAEALDKYHIMATNSKTYNNEGSLQSAICLAYFYARETYTLIQELTTGQGYADVVFLPRFPNKPAIVVELKTDKTTDTALTQIKNKQYGQDLQHYSGNMILVAINYDKDTKKHTCKIEKTVK